MPLAEGTQVPLVKIAWVPPADSGASAGAAMPHWLEQRRGWGAPHSKRQVMRWGACGQGCACRICLTRAGFAEGSWVSGPAQTVHDLLDTRMHNTHTATRVVHERAELGAA